MRRRRRHHLQSIAAPAAVGVRSSAERTNAAPALQRSSVSSPPSIRLANVSMLGSVCGNRAVQRALGATAVQRAGEAGSEQRQPQRLQAAAVQANRFDAIEAQLDARHVQSIAQVEAALALAGAGGSGGNIITASGPLPPEATVGGWGDDAEEWLSEAADTVADTATDVVDTAVDIAGSTAEAVGEGAAEVVDWTTETVNSGIDTATGVAESVGEQAGAVADLVGDTASSVAGEVGGAVDAAAGWGQEKVDESIAWAEEKFKEATEAGEESVGDRTERIEEGVKAAGDWLTDTFGGEASAIAESIDGIVESVEDRVADLGEQAEAKADQVSAWLDDPAGMAEKRIEELQERYQGLYDDARSRIEDLANGELPPEVKAGIDILQQAVGELGKPFGPDTDFGEISEAIQGVLAGLGEAAAGGALDANAALTGQPSATKIVVNAPATNSISASDLNEFASKLGSEAGSCSRTIDQCDTQYDDDSTDKVILGAQVQVTISSTLPVWAEAGSQCKEAQDEYNRFKGAIAAHEQDHVTRYKTAWTNVHAKMVGKKKVDADKAFDAVDAAAEKDQANYDTTTNHGINATPSTKIADITCGLKKVP